MDYFRRHLPALARVNFIITDGSPALVARKLCGAQNAGDRGVMVYIRKTYHEAKSMLLIT